ncbi:hypothetical protein PSTG_15712 [Puccinia striiformis f. sp. tritici PST-78]|uniref:DDE Tnp4 domain-containing protein n=1 Tax=Puccinia striiformis f. sp. tritici PST-78 TaxID=1165861 RepID=A0A0L0UVS0_9BASI|nr:hypothetical protein PSTG_15712 [Puccinia striiformis f. sp. tritici PST-78]
MDETPFHELTGSINQSINHSVRDLSCSIPHHRISRQQDEDEESILLIVSLAVLGERGHLRQLRTYLTRGDLPGNPRADSAWAYLYSAQNDRAFITTMGVDVKTFDDLLSRFLVHWETGTLPRNDVNPNGDPQVGHRSLDAAGCLGLVLHWISSTLAGFTLQQIFAITPAVCSRYITIGLDYLLIVLDEHPMAKIIWPSRQATARKYSQSIQKKFPRLTKCFGFLDGLNLPVLVSDDNKVQNAYYNGWTCSHYCSCILTYAPDGALIHSVLNAPGSWHDSAIAEPLYNKLLYNTPEGYRVISDTAFPRKTDRLRSRILAPVKRGDRLPQTPRSFARLKLLNNQLVSARQAAKWGMHSLQGSFARIKLPLPANDHPYRFRLLKVICRLHQLRCQMVGINQTRSVYRSVWDENQLLCQDFHSMLFSDIQKKCHISQYYHGWL